MITAKKNFDLSKGSLVKNVITYTIPIILTGLLQLSFNAADMIILGRYSTNQAFAAVGSTGALINLIVSVFFGLSVGTSVNVAYFYGKKDEKNLSEVVHTSIVISIIMGIGVAIFGFFLSKPMLTAMKSPDDVIDLATLYMKIYFIGVPASMLYNFGAAALRSVGDTVRPLIFLTISGFINVILNVVFVKFFGMGVSGVAIATVISQFVSAFLVVGYMIKTNGPEKLYLKKLKIHKDKLIQMTKIGLPAGVQGSIFSISNVFIQSAVNTLSSVVMSGSTAAATIEGFIYTSMNSFHHTAVTFVGQSRGEKRYDRIGKITLVCVMFVTLVGVILCSITYIFREPLVGLVLRDKPESVIYAIQRLQIISLTYYLCGIMDVLNGSIRGMGSSFAPMMITVFGTCVTRIIWIYTIFQVDRTIETLYMSYPVSWGITVVAQFVLYFIVKRHLLQKAKQESEVSDLLHAKAC